MSDSIYDKLSLERKELQAKGDLPEWYTTAGWQMFKQKYLFGVKTPREQYRRIAETAAKHMKSDNARWADRFFELLWKGWLSPSTPVLANMGTDRGMPVSCSGGVAEDSIDGFYTALREAAMLTKYGFGTSVNLNGIRPRGSEISVGGKASGAEPVLDDFVRMTRKVAQGTARRGAVACYLDPLHGDFFEIAQYVRDNPDDTNVGWIIRDRLIELLDDHDKDAHERWKEFMHLKAVLGKGYFVFTDKINRLRPTCYVHHGLEVQASNLCSEITLFSDKDHIFTCVLSSMVAARYDEWKDTDAIFVATVFLDCVAEEFIQKAKALPTNALDKAIRFTEKGRALGLGVCGFHTYLQEHMMPFDSVEAFAFNEELFSKLNAESLRASQWMAVELGEPFWCKGFGIRNTHRIAIAPTKSTALIMGGISEGINPDPAMTFTQPTAAGEVDRINPSFLKMMKKLGVYDESHVQEVIDAQGSVQLVSWLTPEQKRVFLTAFEINQMAIIQMASARGIYIDQGQSLNLFFSADEDEAYIAEVHEFAFNDPFITSLYYMYSKSGVTASKGECEACQ